MDNAVRYGEGPYRVRIVPDGSMVTFTSRTAGPGVPEAERAAIFRKYERGSTAARSKGTGLGLYFSRELVALHGGTPDSRGEHARGRGLRGFVAAECSTALTREVGARQVQFLVRDVSADLLAQRTKRADGPVADGSFDYARGFRAEPAKLRSSMRPSRMSDSELGGDRAGREPARLRDSRGAKALVTELEGCLLRG